MSRLTQIVLLLILVNVVVFLWPNNASLAPHVYTTRAELNPHYVRLNKEIEDRFYAKVNDNVTIEASSQTFLEDNSDFQAGNVESVANVISRSGDGVCYRLGPFMYQASYELAKAVLFNANVSFNASARPSKESSVYRLFLGPFANTAEVSDARLDLKRKRILDHFSRKLEDGDYMISLGIYSSQESADAAFRLFSDTLSGVKIKNENVVLPDNYWLHFVLQRSSSKFTQLRDIEWGENSVKLGPHTCRT